eukprot:Nitzschia sp. Nitz4//scaffold336_size18528//1656//2615//NITZ4_008774-RA/size18528-snap-gene-0.1-mRNA-1//-1//CDS//3329548289//6148//frame0
MANKKLFPLKDLNAHDVLLGRGTGPNEHIGNVRYRALVREIIEETDMMAWNSTTKRDLAIKIVAAVKSKGGRFVRKATSLGVGAARLGDVYEEVPDSMAYAKTKQSFRHQLKLIDPAPAGGSTTMAASSTPPSTTAPTSSDIKTPEKYSGASMSLLPPSRLSYLQLVANLQERQSNQVASQGLLGLRGLEPDFLSSPLPLRSLATTNIDDVLKQRERMLLLSKFVDGNSPSFMRSSTLPSHFGATPSCTTAGAFSQRNPGGTALLLEAAIREVLLARQRTGGEF